MWDKTNYRPSAGQNTGRTAHRDLPGDLHGRHLQIVRRLCRAARSGDRLPGARALANGRERDRCARRAGRPELGIPRAPDDGGGHRQGEVTDSLTPSACRSARSAGSRRRSLPLPKETSNGYRPSGLARAGLPVQQQARLVRMPPRPPPCRHPRRRMRMSTSPVGPKLTGLVAFRAVSYQGLHFSGHRRLTAAGGRVLLRRTLPIPARQMNSGLGSNLAGSK
jgi:hypothetical protein